MARGNLGQRDGEHQPTRGLNLETRLGTAMPLTDFMFLGSKVTADGDGSREIKRRLLLGRKAVTNLDSILKSRDTLPTKVHIVRAMVLPVVMYGPYRRLSME